MPLPAGERLGPYEILNAIGAGGMGEVYRARDSRVGRDVAVKLAGVRFSDRFEHEIRAVAALNHPNICTLHDVGPNYLVMELVEGETLRDWLKQDRPLERKLDVVRQVLEGLQAAHRAGFVHRDLKPQNIMVCNDGSIRILDFGIAKAARMRRLTFVGFSPTMGTPDYMAPEQVNGRRGDQRTDIYSLGAILYEMTTGKVPFEGESPYVIMNLRTSGDPPAPRKLNPHLTPVMEEIILHALARNPDERYASAAQMKAELDNYEIVPLVERFKHLQPPRPWKGRFRLLPLILLFVLAQIALFGFMYWYFSTHGKH